MKKIDFLNFLILFAIAFSTADCHRKSVPLGKKDREILPGFYLVKPQLVMINLVLFLELTKKRRLVTELKLLIFSHLITKLLSLLSRTKRN